ncbi:MAG TPA: hypothetical protein VN328_04560 [Thermodesulfovibrionales bacterium]|nr:hypothetical protein [Thermodesulfovibrionales bacterium]
MLMAGTFFIVMLVFLAVILYLKLYKFQGTRLRVRMSYALALSLFFTLYFLWQTQGNIHIIGRGILVGVILFIPFSLFDKRWLDKKIEGTKIVYKKKGIYLNLLSVFLVVILTQLLITRDFFKAVLELTWPMLGMCFGWFLTQAYLLLHVIKLEKKLGAPILEEKKVESNN